jgi:ElaB/YqjD/DUF883 family membrane-anchored ribosome-binding protein
MNNRIETEALVTDLKSVVRDSEQLLQAVAGVTGEKAEALRERLRDSVQAAKDACGKLEAKTKESLQMADRTVRAHPYESIGVALAAGLVIGALIARK